MDLDRPTVPHAIRSVTRSRIPDADRIVVCYLSGLDRRRLSPGATPSIHALSDEYPSAVMVGFPDTELASTIMSGALPHAHGLWQVALDPRPCSSRLAKLGERLPDLVTTTVQCAIYMLRPGFDLPAMPYRRRRRLKQTRFKYYTRARDPSAAGFPYRIGESPTLFSHLPPGSARHHLSTDLLALWKLLPHLFAGGERLEFLEIRGLDVFEHWHLDNPAAVAKAYGVVDRFIAALGQHCDQHGVLMLLVSDHGQEPVRRRIDLADRLRRLGLREDEYDMFLEVPSARFWLHTDRARERIGGLLESLGGTVLTWRDLTQFGIAFPDGSRGELYWIAEPGQVIFPHDFHHPIGNLAMAAADWQQRPRLSSAVHRGYHAYMPHHPCEQGFVLVRSPDRSLRDVPLRLVDVAPTVLHLLGVPQAPHMPGQSAVVA